MVIEIDSRGLAYADIVDRLEDVQAANGGSLQEDIGAKRVAYSAPDGAEFVIDLGRGRLKCLSAAAAVSKLSTQRRTTNCN